MSLAGKSSLLRCQLGSSCYLDTALEQLLLQSTFFLRDKYDRPPFPHLGQMCRLGRPEQSPSQGGKSAQPGTALRALQKERLQQHQHCK